MNIYWRHIAPEQTRIPSPIDNVRNSLKRFLTDILDMRNSSEIFGAVDVLYADQPDEVRVCVIIVECRFYQTNHCIARVERFEFQVDLGLSDVGIRAFEHRAIEPELSAKIIIDHTLRRLRSLGDR